MNTADAVRGWVHGWTVSRGTAEPVPAAWGFTVDVGLPGHVVRHALSAADEAAVREITENTAAPGVWLKVPAPPDVLEPWLGPAGPSPAAPVS
ncbi:hypothetical protein [Streptomyces sp. NPDC058751]|uniref:hypothetical protein n=1 Tax=Streptomyces sp. NPDC058751 TaxID=3346623 RepID=UPI0036CB928F